MEAGIRTQPLAPIQSACRPFHMLRSFAYLTGLFLSHALRTCAPLRSSTTSLIGPGVALTWHSQQPPSLSAKSPFLLPSLSRPFEPVPGGERGTERTHTDRTRPVSRSNSRLSPFAHASLNSLAPPPPGTARPLCPLRPPRPSPCPTRRVHPGGSHASIRVQPVGSALPSRGLDASCQHPRPFHPGSLHHHFPSPIMS